MRKFLVGLILLWLLVVGSASLLLWDLSGDTGWKWHVNDHGPVK